MKGPTEILTEWAVMQCRYYFEDVQSIVSILIIEFVLLNISHKHPSALFYQEVFLYWSLMSDLNFKLASCGRSGMGTQ